MGEFTNSLLIIIVTYNRALEECESFRSVLNMREESGDLEVYVYDNSLNPQPIKEYSGLDITYCHDPENSGVSKAYNSGAAFALSKGKEWILLLDQDTTLPKTVLADYRGAITANPDMKLIVPVLRLGSGKIFSPCAYRFKRGFYLDKVEEGEHSLFKLAPVNSGIMVALDAFQEVGGYNEKVKLDFSDFQFIERFRRQYPTFYVMGVDGYQDFSDEHISFTSQRTRFEYYCEGARNIEKNTALDRLQYHVVVLLRAISLSLKYWKLDFLSLYFKRFLISSN